MFRQVEHSLPACPVAKGNSMVSITVFSSIFGPSICSRHLERKCALQTIPTYQCQLRRVGRSSHLAPSHNRQAEIQLGWPSSGKFYNDSDGAECAGRIDVLGLGQAMIDFGAVVGDETLQDLQVDKGARK